MTSQKNIHNIFIRTRSEFWICLFLIMATLAVYGQVRHFDFINFDDPLYLSENPHVKKGLSCRSIIWAFTTIHAANWHPLTWLSHMLDVHFYGMNPGPHHLTNLQFHIANTLLVFFVFRLMTGALWRSAVIAVLFALHPLHVESVAWVAERKDVLSTFFWMLTLLLYTWHVRRPATPKYLAVILCFSLGLMSKPMLVTVPVIFLLLDCWPLGRFQDGPRVDDKNARPGKTFLFLVCEKIPFFILSAASGVVAILAQQKGGSLSALYVIPISARIANALVSYVAYIGKMIWPSKLAVIYPYSHNLPLWQITAAGLIIISISLMVFKVRWRQPFFIFGWLWYLITLIPVIGLVQVGFQSMADRYTYVPIIGLFIMIVWGIPDKFFQQCFSKAGLATAGSVLLFTLIVATWGQIRYWENSITLFQHALRVTDRNYFAYNNLGVALDNQGKTEAAIQNFIKALQINPDFAHAHFNLGNALAKQGKSEEAIRHYSKVLQLDPGHVDVRNNLGNIMSGMGKFAEAAVYYAQALRLDPSFSQAHNNLGVVLSKQERTEEAIKHYLKALQLDSEYTEAYYNLGNTLSARGRFDEAIHYYSKVVHLAPEHIEAIINLGNVLAKLGRSKEAISQYKKALQLQPDNLLASNNLRETKAIQEKMDRAIVKLQKAIAQNPDDAVAHYELGQMYKSRGELEIAAVHYREALSIDPAFFGSSKNLAIIYAMQGNYDTARSILKESIAVRPDQWEAYYYIAGTYARQKKIEEAVQWLKQAVEKGFDNWDLLKTDQNLERTRTTSYYKELLRNH
ncbi:MAG: tetratricopeptide repeat protein [Desulfobacterales bacterium]|nr:tetratricopeptide repeat protein [Desulfobacterales bacterium]